MTHPLLEVVELLKPRRPIGCRAAFCVYCHCLSRHLVYDNPAEPWRRAVGSENRDWLRFQVCQVCQVRSPHRAKQRVIDPLRGLQQPILELWEQTADEEVEARTYLSMQRELVDRRTAADQHRAAMTGAAFAWEDRWREFQRGLDKLVATIVLFSSIMLLALFSRSPHAVALLIGLLPAAALARFSVMRRFERREFYPLLANFLSATGISESALRDFVWSQRQRLPTLARRFRRLKGVLLSGDSGQSNGELARLRPGHDYLRPPS